MTTTPSPSASERPPSAFSILILLLLWAFACRFSAGAQVVFPATDVPRQIGQYQRACYSTNVNIASLLSGTNGPLYWDLSQPRQPNETILRTDVVPTDDGGYGGSFLDAAYAERDTVEPSAQIAWRYYSMSETGRLYHGMYVPADVNASPLTVFDEPTVDIPATVQFGPTWTRHVTWHDTVLTLPVTYYFTADVRVDAYGVMALPEIGDVPVLRVNERHDYQADAVSWGMTIVLQTNCYYYWVSPRLGIVAQALSLGNNVLFPMTMPHTNVLLRVFESSQTTNLPPLNPVTDLRIRIEDNRTVLDWNERTHWIYRIEGEDDPAAVNWQHLASCLTNSWSEPVGSTQRFYRAFWR